MNINTIHEESSSEWWSKDGNNTLAITYPLNENSVVVDLGGYHGIWASQIIEKYNPYMVLVEPIPQFYHFLADKFKSNPKVKILNTGISTSVYTGELFLDNDGTSKYIKTSMPIEVDFGTIEQLLNTILTIYCKEQVDLIQINIEGEEYPLLEQMLDNNTILRFSNIQIQYHIYIENAIEKREEIQKRMSEHFNKIYDVPFIFEGWSLK